MATHPDTQGPEEKGIARLVIAGVIVLAVIVFAFSNRGRVEVDWIFFDRSSRLIYVIIGSALLGALADRMLIRRRRAPKE